MAGRQQKDYKNSEKQHKYFVLNEEEICVTLGTQRCKIEECSDWSVLHVLLGFHLAIVKGILA